MTGIHATTEQSTCSGLASPKTLVPTFSPRARGELDLYGNAAQGADDQLSGTLRARKQLARPGFSPVILLGLRTIDVAPQEAGLGNLETT